MPESNPLYEVRRLRPEPPNRLVCPHCKTPVTLHVIECDDFHFASSHCHTHGDVVPMRSAVVNQL